MTQYTMNSNDSPQSWRRDHSQNNQLSGKNISRHKVILGIMLIALVAFEVFNFDTTEYALESLLVNVQFGGIGWATILAIAFCAIDVAGLFKIFTPETGRDEPKEVWYLMGAWLLGATMNAVMTWWAISLTLLNNPAFIGNEVLSRGQLLSIVPIFVAVLVWLTRILFIGGITISGEVLMAEHRARRGIAPQAMVSNTQHQAMIRERRADEATPWDMPKNVRHIREESPVQKPLAQRRAPQAASAKQRNYRPRPGLSAPVTASQAKTNQYS